MDFAIKMLLDVTYGLLNLLELFFNCFDSVYQAEYEFQNSNVGEKRKKYVLASVLKAILGIVFFGKSGGKTKSSSKGFRYIQAV